MLFRSGDYEIGSTLCLSMSPEGESGMTTTELLRPVTGPKALELYPFQTEAIESLRVAARSGNRRIILCAPTGSGKTEMAIHLIQEAQRKGSKVTFVVDGISLAEQTSARLVVLWH